MLERVHDVKSIKCQKCMVEVFTCAGRAHVLRVVELRDYEPVPSLMVYSFIEWY